MAVNVGKTKFVIYHTEDKQVYFYINANELDMYNPNLLHSVVSKVTITPLQSYITSSFL